MSRVLQQFPRRINDSISTEMENCSGVCSDISDLTDAAMLVSASLLFAPAHWIISLSHCLSGATITIITQVKRMINGASDARDAWRWNSEEVTTIPDDAREVLEKYSGIESKQVIPHILDKREKGFAIYPYPCIGQLRFLSLNLSHLPIYPQILSRVKNGEKLLDAGCCFGQDIRKLVYDGAPSDNIFALDLDNGFADLGYDLFQDRKSLKTIFTFGSILDEKSDFTFLEGKMDMICIVSFLHLWKWDDQIKAGRRLASFTNPKQGSVIVGRQVGRTIAGEMERTGTTIPGTPYRHNPESFEKLWKQIGEETNTKWTVHAELYKEDRVDWQDDTMRMIRFEVHRA